jgi:hypothetical protein
VLALAALVLATLGMTGGGAVAATPSSGAVSPTAPQVSWQGKAFTAYNPVFTGECVSPDLPTCDVYNLDVAVEAGKIFDLEVSIKGSRASDWFGLYVHKPDGTFLTANGVGPDKTIRIDDAQAGAYRIEIYAVLGEPGDTYSGTAVLEERSDTTPPAGGVGYAFDAKAPKAQAEVPLRVVLVGFGANEVDASKLIAQLPESQRPGVLIPYAPAGGGLTDCTGTGILFGLEQLVNHGRCFFDANEPFLVPVQYNWKPQVIHAPAAFTNALFAQMAANSTTGEFKSSGYRQYLEKYNANRGVFRGADKLVTPNAPARFIDAEKVEDWLAQNSREHLGFDLGGRSQDDPGVKPGYTIFVLNTWDSAAAKQHLKPEHEYHAWKVVRIDPDLGTDEGIDWARVWGGRYRELILDLGAAPNPYESETWGNRGRAVFGSDSFEPPLWEYRANAPKAFVPSRIGDPDNWDQAVDPGSTWDRGSLEFNLARFVVQAASHRFLHSYLYEPRPATGKYYLSSNVWHDAKAEVPWASDLRKLWKEEDVLAGLRTLVPYFTFDGDTEYKYLALTDDEQAMLDAAKQNGFTGAAHTAMNEPTAMDWLDARPERFARGGSCYTNIPSLSVVAEKHYAFGLPVLALGVATNRAGVPWGFLASVNDITKGPHGDRDEITKMSHVSAYENAFSYTATHEISHYLGLAHPHDSLAAWKNPTSGDTEYFYEFTWTFNSTAAPTTYSHVEMTYSVLDQESVARGHTAYYIKWAEEALRDGGDAYVAAGKTDLSQLPERVRNLRQNAITLIASARKDFQRFRFIPATFAAQKAWRNAAAYLDAAMMLAPGSTELRHGTKLQGAAGCASAALAAG